MRLKQQLTLTPLEERALMAWPGFAPTEIIPPGASTAIVIPTTMTTRSGINSITRGEVDYYRITPSTSGAYVFEATTPTSELDTVIGVFNKSGAVLASNDNFTGTDSSVTANVLAGETYYFGVTNKTGSLMGRYSWKVTTPGLDDTAENNDTPARAHNLGKITGAKSFTNLAMRDLADWYKFSYTGLTNAGSFAQIAFANANGDIDLGLFDAQGNLIRSSTSTNDTETILFDGLVGGTYFLKAYGYNGTTNSSYNLNLNITSTPIKPGSRNLYLNFDGAFISSAALNRMNDDWTEYDAVNYWDSQGDGIRVGRFLSGVTNNPFSAAEREAIITRIIQYVQEDVRQYGIRVIRHRGGAVEGVGATTVFIGPSTLENGFHIACDIDANNNNRSDIAFVGDNGEVWNDSVVDTAIALADVVLHEAGHTWGMWHVASGSDLETMGLRYNTSSSFWVQNTSFLNVQYAAYVSGGQPHGPGPQNAKSKMIANFGQTSAFANKVTSPAFTVDTSARGVFTVNTYGALDKIEIEQLDGGMVEVRINDEIHRIFGEVHEIRVQTHGDQNDTVTVVNQLDDVEVTIDRSVMGVVTKIAAEDAPLWTGHISAFQSSGQPCSCFACTRPLIAGV